MNIPKSFNESLWDNNPHLIYLRPFSILYGNDKSKNKVDSNKDLWCIFWMSYPDEENNRYYRLPENERLEVCKEFNPKFDITNALVKQCMDAFPFECLDAVQLAYKQSKDQLLNITNFLNTQTITFKNAELLIKLKAQLPKIYADFAKVEKDFKKHNNERRVFGNRQQTVREKGLLIPEEE